MNYIYLIFHVRFDYHRFEDIQGASTNIQTAMEIAMKAEQRNRIIDPLEISFHEYNSDEYKGFNKYDTSHIWIRRVIDGVIEYE